MANEEKEKEPGDKMFLILFRKHNELLERVNELIEQQTRLARIVERVYASSEEIEQLERRLRRVEKMMNLPAEINDREG